MGGFRMGGEMRQGSWLAVERINQIGLVALILMYLVWVGGTWGNPLTTHLTTPAADRYPESDFLCFYAASSLALAGTPTAVYDVRLKEKETNVAHGKDFQPRPFWYPPSYLLLILPLAWLPFLPSLILWSLITLGGFLFILKRTFPHPLVLWAALASPATFQNLIRGQNAFLSVVLVGGGLLLLESAPFAAGLLLGMLAFKPNLAVLIPVALLAGRRWRALSGAAVSATGLALLSLAVFGPQSWLAYQNQLSTIVARLTPDFCYAFNMTTYALAGGCGSSPGWAKGLQLLMMGLVALAVVWTWSGKGPLEIKKAILIVGMLLFSPYVLVYDLALLALTLAWMVSQGLEDGWLPGERKMVLLGWLLPFYSLSIAIMIKIQIAPLILAGLLLLNLRRLFLERKRASIFLW